jgi:hypothetical protein
VESRVKATLSKKDEALSVLREQAGSLSRQLAQTEGMLAQTREELGDL